MTHYLRLLSLVVSAMLLAVKAVAGIKVSQTLPSAGKPCLLYTSDAADEL